MPASGDKTCLCGTTVQAKHYTRHLGRCDKYKDVQSRAQGTVFRAHVEDTDAIEDADDMDDSLGDGHDVGLHAPKRARPVAQPVGGLGAHVPGLRIMPMHGCTPLLPAALGLGGLGGASAPGARSTTSAVLGGAFGVSAFGAHRSLPGTHGYSPLMPAAPPPQPAAAGGAGRPDRMGEFSASRVPCSMPAHGCASLSLAAGGPAAGGGTISEQLRAASSRQATSTHTLLNAFSNQVSNVLLVVGRLPVLVASAIPAAFVRFEDEKSARQEAAVVGPTLASQLRLCRSVAEVVRLDAGLRVDWQGEILVCNCCFMYIVQGAPGSGSSPGIFKLTQTFPNLRAHLLSHFEGALHKDAARRAALRRRADSTNVTAARNCAQLALQVVLEK
ncbi:hypothetical protein T492DRAFT_22914 [Pavlovales sp. CCMP2436]|nr:hypothetical protein T492DRAFT_22914 [Pavlovales sp. CCMP2436]